LTKFFTKGFLKFVVFLELAVLFFVLFLYLLSAPETLKYAVDRATDKLDIQYDTISGSFLKTISLTNLRYHDKLLAKEAEIDWNIRALIQGDIEIEMLSLQNLDVENLQKLIQSFESNNSDNKISQKPSKHTIPKVSISHLSLSTLPYHSKWVDIEHLNLDIYDISSDLKELAIKRFSIDTQTDYATLKTAGYIEDKILHLKETALHDINLKKILEIAQELKSNEDNKTQSFDLLERVEVEDFDATLLPFVQKSYTIDKLHLHLKETVYTIATTSLDIADFVLDTKSTLGALALSGTIKENHFIGNSQVNLAQKYFQQFTNIVDFASLNPIELTLDANETRIKSSLKLKSKQVFAGRYKDYLAAINGLKSDITFDIASQKLTALTDANVSSKYASSLLLKDKLIFDGNLSYGGTIAISGLQHFPDYSLPLFTHAVIDYKGDKHDLTANLNTDKVHLLYEMYHFKRADFSLDSKELEIAKYFPFIPKFLHPLKAKLDAKMALDFHHALPLKIKTNISSNLVNIDGETIIQKGQTHLHAKTKLSKNSMLQTIDNKIKLQNIFPADFDLYYHDKNLTIDMQGKNSLFTNHFYYDINTTQIEETLSLVDNKITLKGPKDKLNLRMHTFSLKTLQEQLSSLYEFKKEPYDGEVKVSATIQNLETMQADIDSRWLVYEYTPNKFAFAEKIKINLALDSKKLEIKNYNFHTYLDEDRLFYASKPSLIYFKNAEVEVADFWVNDGIKTQGTYNLNQKYGHFLTTAKNYHYKGKEGDIHVNTNIKTTLTKEDTTLEGSVDVLSGIITYQHRKTHEIQDPDIIIIQEEKERLARKAEKKNNFILDISIKSNHAITYKVPKVEVAIIPDIKIWKERQKDIELLGRLVIKHGSYDESNKHFTILPGEILFGGEMLNPYLNIKAQYKNNPYTIHIDIAGTLDSPLINFSSDPYLSQSDILSMLLFSSTTDSLFEGSSSSSNQALSMLGNTFAKEIVKNFGLTLDKLVISTNEEGGLGIEIGKKISKKVTVIYINDIVQSIKVRYQHSERFETDLMISPESSGIDFIYKSEH
jgi:translocation and assembly module TamB